MFGMMTLCMVAMLALFYLGMIARDARCTCREGKSKNRIWCKVARFNYRLDACGAPDDLLLVTPKPVLHALTERRRRESEQLSWHATGNIFAD